jgi:LmbE family N-acetylglucosaminyl deacetylase
MFFNEPREPIRVAVISAHPDDETFGAGGTLAKHAAFGDELHICVVTKGYAPDWPEETIQLMHEQTMAALETLGIQNVEFLQFPTVKLNAVPGKELNDRIADFINNIDPQVVYAPFPGDLNSDHGIVARSTAIAVRPLAGTRRSLLYFETLSSTEWGRMFLQSSFRPNLYVDICSTLEQKLKAASCYDLEIMQFPHPRSIEGIRVLAKRRGMEVGLKAAEAFSLALHVT